MRKKCYSLVLSGIFLLMAPLEFCSGKENVSIMKQDEKLFESRHFDIEELADGVFTAIHKDGGAAICNAGIIDLGDRTLIFDSFLTPQAARDLKAASEALTGKAVSIVINSHCHNDHIWGNQVFEGHAEIISSGETRQVIATAGMKEYEWFKENAAKRLKSIQDEYESIEDEAARGELTMWLSYYQGLVDDLPELRVVQPTLTFEGRFEIPGTRRLVELIEYHDGHTKSDVILYLPQDCIIFMGDILLTLHFVHIRQVFFEPFCSFLAAFSDSSACFSAALFFFKISASVRSSFFSFSISSAIFFMALDSSFRSFNSGCFPFIIAFASSIILEARCTASPITFMNDSLFDSSTAEFMSAALFKMTCSC